MLQRRSGRIKEREKVYLIWGNWKMCQSISWIFRMEITPAQVKVNRTQMEKWKYWHHERRDYITETNWRNFELQMGQAQLLHYLVQESPRREEWFCQS